MLIYEYSLKIYESEICDRHVKSCKFMLILKNIKNKSNCNH